MLAFILSPVSKHIKAFALIASVLLVLFSSLITAHHFSRWNDAKTEYSSWITEDGPRCTKLYKAAESELAALGKCRMDSRNVDSFFECKSAERLRKEEVLARMLNSGCSREAYFSTPGEIPKLRHVSDPGPFPKYVLSAGADEWGKGVALLLSGLCALLLLTDVTKRLILERNTGWRRLTIVVPVVISIAVATIYFFDDYDLFPDVLLVAVFTLSGMFVFFVYGRVAVQWVVDGFAETKSLSIKSEETPTVVPTLDAIAPSSESDGSTTSVSEQAISPRGESTESNLASYWTRVWARSIDVVLAFFLADLAYLFLPMPGLSFGFVTSFILDRVLSVVLLSSVVIGYDTLLLSKFGTTPGKILFGLYVETPEGERISFSAAFERSVSMLAKGLWFMLFFPYIQIVNSLRMSKRESLPWDFPGRWGVYQRPCHPLRRRIGIGFAVLLLSGFFVAQRIAKEDTKEYVRKTAIEESRESVIRPPR
jgi:uncharacterized RDD family membrane protein YckC